eukprot:COSAG02_NODE_67115_length_253_cov_2.012987_1_plen_40_part_10
MLRGPYATTVAGWYRARNGTWDLMAAHQLSHRRVPPLELP